MIEYGPGDEKTRRFFRIGHGEDRPYRPCGYLHTDLATGKQSLLVHPDLVGSLKISGVKICKDFKGI